MSDENRKQRWETDTSILEVNSNLEGIQNFLLSILEGPSKEEIIFWKMSTNYYTNFVLFYIISKHEISIIF